MTSDALIDRLGHRFNDPALLRTALTHRSYSAQHNERLEFLGDSVLNCVISDALYRRFPHLAEGELSRARALLVRQQTLFERADAMGLGNALLLGEGELRSGGKQRPSILADALEALIGAVYLDAGFDTAREVVRKIFDPMLTEADQTVLGKDPKTLLQELLQSRHMPLPQYVIVATEGEAHRQRFKVECVVPSLSIRAVGEGLSRRAAEQNAADNAYRQATGG
ncbi:MAG: ribonuclease III [Betaproteobacteria bacterium]|nr:MAG: ribonuclease III [Betaproteobacteria bacterium]